MDKFEQSMEFLMNTIDSPCFFCNKANCVICDNMDQWCLSELQVSAVVDEIFQIGGIKVEVE